ncbi:unnamed protein product [Knipowitschia caucasica]
MTAAILEPQWSQFTGHMGHVLPEPQWNQYPGQINPEPQWNQYPGHMGHMGLLNPDPAGSVFSEPWTTERRTTVKELLRLKRQVQEEGSVKRPKLDQGVRTEVRSSPPIHLEDISSSWHPGCGAPTVAIETGGPDPPLPPPPYLPPHLPPPPPPAGHAPVISLFQWQVQQQLRRIKGVPAEVLTMRDADGDTPLHIAVAQGKRALAYVLAAHMSVSGTLDTQEHNGQTALHIAAATDQALIINDLLEHGAQLHIRDTWGRSPLHVCVEKRHVRSLLAVFRTLQNLQKEVDVDMVNYEGLTCLHVAVLAHGAVLRQVSASGGDLGPEGSMCSKEALLQRARRAADCVRALLHMGASCGVKDPKSGRTVVHMAAEHGDTQLLRLLLQQPSALAELNTPTFSGNTALHVLCGLQSCERQLEGVKMLLRRGADPGARNLENELPYQLLPEGGAAEKVRQVLKMSHVHM